MKCNFCGKEIPEGSRFCTECGAPAEGGSAGASGSYDAAGAGSAGASGSYDATGAGSAGTSGSYDASGSKGASGSYGASGSAGNYDQGSYNNAGNYNNNPGGAYNGSNRPSGGGGIDIYGAAILCYFFGIIGWLVAYLASDREDPFLKFHLNQALVLFLATFLTAVPLVGAIWGVFVFVCWIISLVGAIKKEQNPAPLLGKISLLN